MLAHRDCQEGACQIIQFSNQATRFVRGSAVWMAALIALVAKVVHNLNRIEGKLNLGIVDAYILKRVVKIARNRRCESSRGAWSITDGVRSKAEVASAGGLIHADREIEEFVRAPKVIRQQSSHFGLVSHSHSAFRYLGPRDSLCASFEFLCRDRRNIRCQHVHNPSNRPP